MFDAEWSSTITATRNGLEYLDVDHQREVDEGEARWAVQLAARAVEEVSEFLG